MKRDNDEDTSLISFWELSGLRLFCVLYKSYPGGGSNATAALYLKEAEEEAYLAEVNNKALAAAAAGLDSAGGRLCCLSWISFLV